MAKQERLKLLTRPLLRLLGCFSGPRRFVTSMTTNSVASTVPMTVHMVFSGGRPPRRKTQRIDGARFCALANLPQLNSPADGIGDAAGRVRAIVDRALRMFNYHPDGW